MNMPLTTEQLVHRIAADDFNVFAKLAFHTLEPGKPLVRGWYLDAMAAALSDVESGACLRQLITIPPRHMKSLYGSVAFPAWVLGRDPGAKLICVSYSQDLSVQHAQNFRRLVQSDMYRCVFPRTASSFSRIQENCIQTRQGGYRMATSLGGTITGFGADYIVIDDLMKAIDATSAEARTRAKQFLDQTLLSRLNDKKTGRIISIQQRLHQDDIVAYLKEKGRYQELELPAIALKDEEIPLGGGRVHHRKMGDVLSPEREPADVLAATRQEMGSRVFEAQWQQNPTSSGCQIVDCSKLHRYDEPPQRNRLFRIVHSWDTAYSTENGADYSVGMVFGYDGECWYLLDVIRVRLAYPDLLARVRLERKRWRADLIIIEKSSMGPALLGDLSRDLRCLSEPEHHAPNCGRLGVRPHEPKQERMMAGVERLYAGKVKFPRAAPWLDDLHSELNSFPDGVHDDQVDSLSQFLNIMVGPVGRGLMDTNDRRDTPRRP